MDRDSNESSREEKQLELDCVLSREGVNWPVVVPVTTTWNGFLSIIAKELEAKTEEIKLSYRFSSFTAAENSEVLCSHDHYKSMKAKAKEFLTGTRKVRGGKAFRIHLNPIFKRHPSTPVTEDDRSKKGGKKVGRIFL